MIVTSRSSTIAAQKAASIVRLLLGCSLLLVICCGLYILTKSPAGPTTSSPSLEPNALWRENVVPLPRPLPVPNSPTIRRDHAILADRAINSAKILHEQGITFRLIVFAWKRRASLIRLLDSLRFANYHGFAVHLDFHIDGEAHEKVLKFVDNYTWPFGRIRIHRHLERIGLERVSLIYKAPIMFRR